MKLDVDALLDTRDSTGRVALAAKVALSQCSPDADCPVYLAELYKALDDEPPPFDTAEYADVYLDASADWHWMAVSLITNAEREGDGSNRLWSLAACCDNPEIRPLLKQHSVDESRHALLYLALLDLTFAGRIEPTFRRELNLLSPGHSLRHDLAPVPGSPYAKNPSLDDFLQMNIAEIRTTIHHIMQRPAIARHCPPDQLHRTRAVQDSLLRDELKHVAYTAVLIDRIGRGLDSGRLSALFRRRFHDFNQITLDELGEGAFDCSVACCTRHSTCRARAAQGAENAIPLHLVN